MFVERRGQMAPKLSPELEAVQEDALGRALARFEQRFSAMHNALPATDSSRCIMRQQVCIQRFCAEELRMASLALCLQARQRTTRMYRYCFQSSVSSSFRPLYPTSLEPVSPVIGLDRYPKAPNPETELTLQSLDLEGSQAFILNLS